MAFFMRVLITNLALESALRGSKNTWPDEFVAILSGNANAELASVGGIVIAPLSFYGRHSSGFSDWHVPTNKNNIGTYHSHPNAAFEPSREDLLFFSRRGRVHFIGRHPFSGPRDAAAYDAGGNRVEFSVTT